MSTTRPTLSPAAAGERVARSELIDRNYARRFADDPELAEIMRRAELVELDELLDREEARR